ncbi:MAG: hypothetical protein DRO12_04550 [Thermoprotei archaeon]|nr:MAG: hypothetical protein DRO12_04550 [Thermoprotei archaeon]
MVLSKRSRVGSGQEMRRRFVLGLVWSSEYPFVTAFAKILRNRLGATLEVVIYNNGLDATWDLVLGRIDMVLSPLVTQILYYALTDALRIVGGGAAGGAAVFINTKGVPGVVSSTKASTMELCIIKALRELGIVSEGRLYRRKGEEIMRDLELGRASLAAVWEPLAIRLRMEGFREVANCLDLGIVHCCTLAVSSGMSWELAKKVSLMYQEAIAAFTREPRRWIEWYSAKVGIDSTYIVRTLEHYVYLPRVDVDRSIDMLSQVGVALSSPALLREAVIEVAR